MTKTDVKDWLSWYWPHIALVVLVLILVCFGIADGSVL